MDLEITVSLLREIRNDYQYRLNKMKNKMSRAIILDKMTAINNAIVACQLMDKLSEKVPADNGSD